jgi:signal transduction histidine kinase
MAAFRLLLVAPVLAGLLLGAGLGWEAARFGTSPGATIERLQREVRRHVHERAAAVDALAARVADARVLIEAAASGERVAELFDLLAGLPPRLGEDRSVGSTVYVPEHGGTSYRVLAWSDGPAEQDLSVERLSGPASVFVAPGHSGMRLVAVRPIETDGRHVAVAVAETILAPNSPGTSSERRLPTSFGSVSIVEQYASQRDDLSGAEGFLVTTASGAPLLEVHYTLTTLNDARQRFRRQVIGVTLVPFAGAAALGVPVLLSRRRRGDGRRRWIALTVAGASLLIVAVALAAVAANWIGLPDGWRAAFVAAAWVALAVIGPGALWWRVHRRGNPFSSVPRFVAEQLVAGLVLAAIVEAMARLLVTRLTPTAIDRWQFVLFPFNADGLLFAGTLLLTELAFVFTAAFVLAAAAGRWRLPALRPAALVALSVWLAPTVALVTWSGSEASNVRIAALVLAGAVALVALVAGTLRRSYRHTTQSMRLGLGLLALLAPVLAVYPMLAVTAERTTREVIEREYAPATALHPEELRAELRRTLDEIDRLPILPSLVSSPPSLVSGRPDSQAAYLVWSHTSLSKTRAVQDVELYGADRTLVSRFALNMPEYLYQTSTQTWQGSSCSWEDGVFGEVTAFGAETRLMLHAERGVCDARGVLLGGIVVHVASNDYQALPFVSSANPYHDALGMTPVNERAPRLHDLQVAVYGWSFQPIFMSGQVAWPVPRETFDRLYRDATPFWTTLEADGRTYQVHFSQNRGGIYALGYPSLTLFEHGMRLAEIILLAVGLFVLIQVGLVASAPLTRRARAPLRLLYQEIRTSFYRKLFLLFVVAAIAPVLVFALAFGSYMTARFRADVEFESKSIVTVARRVFEELVAADERAAPAPGILPSDDLMVWIRQVINQDVNLFQGSALVATSQRDLFDSGLLPTRTPAAVYRGIALQRFPLVVAEDRLGDFEYLVAASPVQSLEPDGVLTVPLASRQREIERQIEDLNRGVLVGGVLVVLFAAAIGASMAGRVADPVARLSRATRQIAAGQLALRLEANTADELGRLVEDFNSMAETLLRQRAELVRANQLEAWNEMARQVAHEIKNPLTPIQLAAEHLQHVHEDRGRPLGAVMDGCLRTVLTQVRLLRQIASEFSNFAARPAPRPEPLEPAALVAAVIDPYRVDGGGSIAFEVNVPPDLPRVLADRTLVSRALTNLVENAVQAMPAGGRLSVRAAVEGQWLVLRLTDTGPGMEAVALARAFEPYFSTKTGGSGLGLPNARRNIETSGGTIDIESQSGVGTTVTVRLPLADPHGAPAAAASRAR